MSTAEKLGALGMLLIVAAIVHYGPGLVRSLYGF
jgi:hypothetical protein